MLVLNVWPLHATNRGSATFTDNTFIFSACFRTQPRARCCIVYGQCSHNFGCFSHASNLTPCPPLFDARWPTRASRRQQIAPRHRFMDMPIISSGEQEIVAGGRVFAVAILIRSS